MNERTAKFLTEEISEDVSTGVTPRKKVWNVPSDWQRTEPREALIAAMRRKATASPGANLQSESADMEAQLPTELSVPMNGVRPTRSHSQQSLSDDSENQRIPSPDLPTAPSINGLSQIKPPSKRNDVGKVCREETGRMAIPILGEGGANIPRRVRK